MIRIMILLAVLAGGAMTMVGCTNTVRGWGQDMESAGESMQNYNRASD